MRLLGLSLLGRLLELCHQLSDLVGLLPDFGQQVLAFSVDINKRMSLIREKGVLTVVVDASSDQE